MSVVLAPPLVPIGDPTVPMVPGSMLVDLAGDNGVATVLTNGIFATSSGDLHVRDGTIRPRDQWGALWDAAAAGIDITTTQANDLRPFQVPDLRGTFPRRAYQEGLGGDGDDEDDVDDALDDLREDLSMRIEEVSEEVSVKAEELMQVIQEQAQLIKSLGNTVRALESQMHNLIQDTGPLIHEWRMEDSSRRSREDRPWDRSRGYDDAMRFLYTHSTPTLRASDVVRMDIL